MKHKFLSSLVLMLAFNGVAMNNAVEARGRRINHRAHQTNGVASKRHQNLPPLFRQQSALVIDDATGKVLFEQDPDQQAYPASMTKMMTLYLTFEALEKGTLKLDQVMTVSALAARQPQTNLSLRASQTIAVGQAISGVSVQSANDAAVVLAETIGGTQENFVRMMNAKAKELGMSNTTFANPNGLFDLHQVSTARDMVKLAQAHLRDFPQYRKYFEQKEFVFKSQTYRNHAGLMFQMPEIDFGKTGYVYNSGANLTVSARRGDARVFASVFSGSSSGVRNQKMRQMLNDAFDKVTKEKQLEQNKQAQPPSAPAPQPASIPSPSPFPLS